MSRTILVDTGPLVALFDRRDTWHAWAVARVREAALPLVTCESVVSEAFHLLESETRESAKLSAMLERGALLVKFALPDQLTAVLELLRRYADTPMALADACLVRMAELDAKAVIMTTDSDFRFYRKSNRQVIPLIFPHVQ